MPSFHAFTSALRNRNTPDRLRVEVRAAVGDRAAIDEVNAHRLIDKIPIHPWSSAASVLSSLIRGSDDTPPERRT